MHGTHKTEDLCLTQYHYYYLCESFNNNIKIFVRRRCFRVVRLVKWKMVSLAFRVGVWNEIQCHFIYVVCFDDNCHEIQTKKNNIKKSIICLY